MYIVPDDLAGDSENNFDNKSRIILYLLFGKKTFKISRHPAVLFVHKHFIVSRNCIKPISRNHPHNFYDNIISDHGLGSALENQDTNEINVSQPVDVSCFDGKESSK